MKNYPEINGIYLHYKGDTYKVLMLAIDSEISNVVIYESIEFGTRYVRKLSEWFEKISDEKNIQRERFQLIKS